MYSNIKNMCYSIKKENDVNFYCCPVMLEFNQAPQLKNCIIILLNIHPTIGHFYCCSTIATELF